MRGGPLEGGAFTLLYFAEPNWIVYLFVCLRSDREPLACLDSVVAIFYKNTCYLGIELSPSNHSGRPAVHWSTPPGRLGLSALAEAADDILPVARMTEWPSYGSTK